MAGSIEKRGENSYRLIVSGGCGPDGKRKKYTKTVNVEGKTDSDKLKKVQKELAKFITDIENNNYTEPSKLTLKLFSSMWLKTYAKPKLALKTIHEYEGLLDLRIIPALGHLKLNKIKPMHLVKFFANLSEDGMRSDKKQGKLSNNTLMHYYRLLSVMFETAFKWKLIPYNPVKDVESPKYRRKEADHYSKEEVQLLLDKLETEPLKYRIQILLALSAGLRAGELTGLKWENINFEENTIEINKATQYLPQEGIFEKDPKNETSNRLISVPKQIIDMLNLHKNDQEKKEEKHGDLWHDSGYVFTQWNGLPIHPETPGKWFNKMLKRHELRKITFHQLRHTSATLLISSGQEIKSVSERLGHSNTTTTLNIYTHADKSTDKTAAEKLGNILFKDSE